MKDELGGKIYIKFAALTPKIYCCLMDDHSSEKKAKETNECVIKVILKFKNYEVNQIINQINQIDNIIKYLEKNGVNTDDLKTNYEQFVKHNKLTLKTQQRFRSKSHNVFTEEI